MKLGEKLLVYYCIALFAMFGLPGHGRIARAQTEPAQTAAKPYTAIDLGTFVPNSLNDAGEMVGTDAVLGQPQLWRNGAVEPIPASPLGAFFPRAINNVGQAVGVVSLAEGNGYRAARWENGSLTLLPEPGVTYFDSDAVDINDAGVIVGRQTEYIPNCVVSPLYGPLGCRPAAKWENGALVTLPILGGLGDSNAIDINNSGQIVGQGSLLLSPTGGGDSQPISAARAVLWQNGTMTELGTLLEESSADAINDAGEIVGASVSPTGTIATRWRSGVMEALPALGGSDSGAVSINNAGKIVGSATDAGGAWHAVLWQGGAAVDLATLVDMPSEWTLQGASHINDNDWIVASAVNQSQSYRFFLLVPVGLSSVSGRVATNLNQSVADVEIQESFQPAAHTDAAGRYTVTGLEPGSFLLTAVHPDYVLLPTLSPVPPPTPSPSDPDCTDLPVYDRSNSLFGVVPPSRTDQDFLAIPAFSGSIQPVFPLSASTPITVEQGGTAIRHFRLLDAAGRPIPSAVVTFTTGCPAYTDTEGYFTHQVHITELGEVVRARVGNIYVDGLLHYVRQPPAFEVHTSRRQVTHFWRYGLQRGGAIGGGPAPLYGYLRSEVNGGMELSLSEQYPTLSTLGDEVILTPAYDALVGIGAGIGTDARFGGGIMLETNAGVNAELTARLFAAFQTIFRSPYTTEQQAAQGALLLLSLVDSTSLVTQPALPVSAALLGAWLSDSQFYSPYLAERRVGVATGGSLDGGSGMRVDLQLAPPAASALRTSTQDPGVTFLELKPVNETQNRAVTLTLIDYVERKETGLRLQTDDSYSLSILNPVIRMWARMVGEHVNSTLQRTTLEVIVGQEPPAALKRIDLSLTGLANPARYPGAAETTVQFSISAQQLADLGVLAAAQSTAMLAALRSEDAAPLLAGAASAASELAALVRGPRQYAYTVAVQDRGSTGFVPAFRIHGDLAFEIKGGLALEAGRRYVAERGVFVDGRGYPVERYAADEFIETPGAGWDVLTDDALGALWETIGATFVQSATQRVDQVAALALELSLRSSGGLLLSTLHVGGTGGVQHASAAAPLTVTVLGWAPQPVASTRLSSFSGAGFAVGGVYQIGPETLDLTSGISLALTASEAALAGRSGTDLTLVRWNPEDGAWLPVAAQIDTAQRRASARITQPGVYALALDRTPPVVTVLSEPSSPGAMSVVVLGIWDAGVGVAPDSITVMADGRPVPATYNPATGTVTVLLDFTRNKPSLVVTITDSLGNPSVVSDLLASNSGARTYLPVIRR